MRMIESEKIGWFYLQILEEHICSLFFSLDRIVLNLGFEKDVVFFPAFAWYFGSTVLKPYDSTPHMMLLVLFIIQKKI